MEDKGVKNDNGKPRFDLIPPYPLEALADLYRIGAEKYADRNWEHGLKYGRVFSAMMRHAWAFWRGESHDPIDLQHHLISVAWCAFALYHYEVMNRNDLDDRASNIPVKEGHKG